jgi:YYY domain-containing protein
MAGRGPAWTRSPLVWLAVAVLAVGCYVAEAPALTLVIPALVGALALATRYLSAEARPSPELVGTPAELARAPARVGAGENEPAPVAGGESLAELAVDHTFVFVMLFVAALLLFGTELVYIQDAFNNRMNTVFKLYFQAWQMLALVSAYAVFYLGWPAFARVAGQAREAAARWRRVSTAAWLVVAAAFVGAAFLYVPAALESRSNGFSNPMTLDGLAYYASSQPDDASAIQWLNQNVAGTPTIVEATGGSYSQFGEVAWMTGLPTILGWDFHEIQWHGASIIPVVDQRKQDVDTIYRSTDAQQVQQLLQKYQVRYVYVGPLERQVYGNDPAGLAKFSQFMDVAYKNASVTIYQTRGGS